MAQPAHKAPKSGEAVADQPATASEPAEAQPATAEPVAVNADDAALTAEHFRPPLVHAWQQQAATVHEEPVAAPERRRKWPLGWAIVFTATVSIAMWGGIIAVAWLLF